MCYTCNIPDNISFILKLSYKGTIHGSREVPSPENVTIPSKGIKLKEQYHEYYQSMNLQWLAWNHKNHQGQ